MENEDFERIRVIGKGSYGEVWLAKHKKDKKQVHYVLKKINLGKASKRERKSAEQEAKLLSKLKHPNIVAYKDSFETDNGFLYIAMQYCEGGDLYARLKEQKSVPLEERQVVEWFVQIAMALQYMHERNILHRDLKTQNIFLTKSKIIKVGDLGIARVLESAGDMATTLIGTPYYMSPELFSNKPYNHKSDVWALGCCVYEMTTLKHAFNAKDMNSLVYKILKGRMPQMPLQYSSELLVLMKSMLHQDPDKRPSVNRILRDPYIKMNIAIFLEDTKKSSRRVSSSSLSSVSSRKTSNPSAILNVASSNESNQASSHALAEENSRLQAENPSKLLKSMVKVPAGDRETNKDVVQTSGQGSQACNDSLKKLSQKDGALRKKNFLKNHAKKNETKDQEIRETERECSKNVLGKPPPFKQSPETHKTVMEIQIDEKPRPLPVPRAAESSGLPQLHNSSNNNYTESQKDSPHSSINSSISSSKEDNSNHLDTEIPKSLINQSARQRRRQQKNDTAGSVENLNPGMVKLRRLPQRTESEKITHAEKKDMPMNGQKPSLGHFKQPSLLDSSSSSEDSQQISKSKVESTNEKESNRRENKELNNFISLLDTTLHNNATANSDEDREDLTHVNSQEACSSTSPKDKMDKHVIHKSVSMPSVETLTNTSRLMDRIKILHKDCIQGVGYGALKKAYEILDKIDEDEVEPKLVDLLGKEKFDDYAGKIWQLKFCEESLFMA
ncbi:unnamed protein product [Lymnaea stagnalis]|uniref:non-specific serine/threonine protein kinase n=1 Tax=Lymnaea stagnalis TaxID=6523 RepID=A0AAV2HL50_LYMST